MIHIQKLVPILYLLHFSILSFNRYDLRSLLARSDFLVRKITILKYKLLLGKHLVVLNGN
jgi:hypothetical protein